VTPPQIGGANVDPSGTTKPDTKLLDHSSFVARLVLSAATVIVGTVIGAHFF
jgi:anaerobic C4-dicarboxylate transporter